MAVDPEQTEQETTEEPVKEEIKLQQHHHQQQPRHHKGGGHDPTNRQMLPLDERMKQFRDMMLERGVLF